MSQVADPNQVAAQVATLQQQLAALLQQHHGQAPAAMAAPIPNGNPFGGAPQGMPMPTGVHIPLKIPCGQGSVKVMLSFGPEYAEPNALMNLLNILGNAGFPVDVYVPKQQGFGGGGFNGGGNGFNRGGYNGGGGYRGGGGWQR